MPAPENHSKWIQPLTTAHWTCSTAAVGVGNDHGQLLASRPAAIREVIYIFFNSSGLVAFDWTSCVAMFMFLIFYGLEFLHVWCLFHFDLLFFADRSLAGCSREKNPRVRSRRHSWAFRCSLQKHQDSNIINLKAIRTYHFCLDFLWMFPEIWVASSISTRIFPCRPSSY